MGWFSNFFSLSKEFAMDLGTANTIIIHNDQIVVDEPSVVALNVRSEQMEAVGERAKQMHEKTNKEIRTVRPLHEGVIADFQACEQLIRGLINMAHPGRSIFSPTLKMVIGVPSGSTEVELRAVRDSAEKAGVREVHLIHEPMAAALGIGLDVLAPEGNMVVDIGGGSTEIAVISLGGIVVNKSQRIAGDNLTKDIQEHMSRQHNMKVNVCYQEVAHSIEKTINMLETAVLQALEETPPELYADIMKNGIWLSGGGALLRGLDRRLTEKLNIPFHVADDPLHCVAKGTGIALKHIDEFQIFLM